MPLNTFLRTGTKYIYWGILYLCLFLCTIYIKAQRFVSVNSCPQNQTEWTRRARGKNCQNPIPDYLCASVQDNPGKYGEICTVVGLANPGTCAVLSKSTYNMDFLPCLAASGCPGTHYKPSELYKYLVCFQNFYGITTMSSSLSTEEDGTTTISIEQTDYDEISYIGTVLGLLISVLTIVTTVIMVILYRRSKLPDIEEENIRMIPESEEHMKTLSSIFGEERTRIISRIHKLPCYLIHILKTELKVRDLKEKKIIYSVSLNEHFGEPLFKVLEKVNDTQDYDNLDIKVIFTLLINFCDNIKPPRTGWGYKPSDDDLSVGADVERIRILWNLYCDDQVDVPCLQGVYGRMSDKFGDLSKEADSASPNKADCNGSKQKIQIVRLKTNYNVENGIVVTKIINSAMALLESSDIVICMGAIGCGKTTAMRYIQDMYEDQGWETVWFEEHINENELIKYENDQKTVIFCDNLFGTFNCKVFSFENVLECERVIQKHMEKSNGHLKVLLGIHQHVYDAVLKLGRVQVMDTKNLIDFDHLDKAEMLLIWKESKKEGHCVRDPSCWFKNLEFSSVYLQLSNNQGPVGNPFLMLMYCQHHDFFSNENFTKSPVTTLVNHFKRMYEKNRELFLVLVYIMFVRVYKVNEDIKPWAGSISADLTEDCIKRCVEKYPEYLIEENDTVELKHELLNISLLKASYDIYTVFSALVHHCDISTILQLTRPKEECDSDFVACFPSSLAEDKLMVKLLEKIATAKGLKFYRPPYLIRLWKNHKK